MRYIVSGVLAFLVALATLALTERQLGHPVSSVNALWLGWFLGWYMRGHPLFLEIAGVAAKAKEGGRGGP